MDCKRAQSMVTPYIREQLNEKETEQFLEHISHCGECYEELEIYFTVYDTLARLEQEEGCQAYDAKAALEERLAESRFHVWKTKVLRFVRYGVMLFAELALLFVLFSQMQFWRTGSMESNPVYVFLNGSARTKTEAETKKDPEIKNNPETEEKLETGEKTETEEKSETGRKTETEKKPEMEKKAEAEIEIERTGKQRA